ncbi:MAG: oligosaccharide flippase family protein [Haliea sp.]|uniref:oligosaccharide flippase family protein n=1 Tax=Haliea sp. TaxID=1932666 RepID=UPI0032EF8A02
MPSIRPLSHHARRALHNTSFQGLTQIWYLLLRAIYVIFFARLVGLEAYGQYNYAQIWYLIALSVTGWGMHEWLLTRWQAVDKEQRQALADTGLALRVLLGTGGTLLVLCCAVILESDPALRWLIMIYAQGVVLRGLTAWLHALFTSRERSELILYTSMPVSLLEVVLALGLAWAGYSLLVIALAQTLCWWLGLAATWWAYRQHLGSLRLSWQPAFAREFLAGGALLALASALLAWMGPGLLVAVRHYMDDGPTLGEAALVIQVLLMLGQALRMVTNATLPFLTRPGEDLTLRQRGFASQTWHVALYLGGAGYLLGVQVLPSLTIRLLGESFQQAGILLAQFSWILIPLGLVQTLRLLLIGRGLYRQFLLALVLGGAVLGLAVAVLVGREALSLPSLFTGLGLAYAASVVVMLRQLATAGIALSAATIIRGPLVLAAAVALSHIAQPTVSAASAALLGISLLALAALHHWWQESSRGAG